MADITENGHICTTFSSWHHYPIIRRVFKLQKRLTSHNIALRIVTQGEEHPVNVFKRYQESEERKFMGDLSFWTILRDLLSSTPPLLKLSDGKKVIIPARPDQVLTITAEGTKLLFGDRNWHSFFKLDRWIGGVHLTPDHSWCWDSEASLIVKD